MDSKLTLLALGFSAGGTFALLNANLMGALKGISFCSQGSFFSGNSSTMPSQWFMSFNDNHPMVGKKGNDTAFINYSNLTNRGVCARYNMWYPSPLYPELFKRIPGIDSAHSLKIFNELVAMGALSEDKIPVFSPDKIKATVISMPGKYPGLVTLDVEQAQEVENQLTVMLAWHHFHSHYNGKLIRFFNSVCGTISTPLTEAKSISSFKIYPNPTAGSTINLELPDKGNHNYTIEFFDLTGRKFGTWQLISGAQKVYSIQLPPQMTNGTYFAMMDNELGDTYISTLVVNR